MIRVPAASDDLEMMARLHAASFDDAWSAESIGALMAQPGVLALVADDSGFILVRIASDESEILTLAVAPATRRRGIGSALVNAAALRASDLGATSMFLEVACENIAAKSLYIRLGFREVGRRPRYYAIGRQSFEDAIVMNADIPLPRV
jgi:[ribosomal protein S18]-alanine N-acetyltransferase